MLPFEILLVAGGHTGPHPTENQSLGAQTFSPYKFYLELRLYLERHFKYNESLSFVRNHRGLAIGNGIVFMLFLLIPIIGVILVLPLSVTAATTQTVAVLQTENRLKIDD